MLLEKCFNFIMIFSWYSYLGTILRYLAKQIWRKFLIKMHGQNVWRFFVIFHFKILIFRQQFPFISLHMHLEKCFNFMMVFSWCVDLGPILRYLATKSHGLQMYNSPIEIHGRNLNLCFIQNTSFSKTVPIYLIELIFRQMFQFYNGLLADMSI